MIDVRTVPVVAGLGRRSMQATVAVAIGLSLTAACSHAASGAQASTSASVGTVSLPMTVTVAFTYPKDTDLAQYMLLSTAEQALRAQLHAIYAANPDDPVLHRYWSGHAYTEIRGQVEQWIHMGDVPVGVVTVTHATVDVLATPTSRVSYCVSLTRVVRGDTRTHVVGSPVQPPGTPGTRETLTVTHTAPHRWTATDIKDVAGSKACPD